MTPSPERIVRLPRRPKPRIAIFAEPRDTHAHALKRSLAKLGANAVVVRFAGCRFATDLRSGIGFDAWAEGLPDAVLVRTIPGGSFETVTRRLGLLHALRESGVLVWNDARAIEACVDKSMTSFLLARAGLPTPPTWTIEDADQAKAIVERESGSGPLVLKPLFGSQGRGLMLIRDASALPPPEAVNGVYYLQRFVGAGDGDFHDYRVFVLNGRALAAMRRRAADWITNVKQGAKLEGVAISPEFQHLATAAAKAVGADFCGVDIIWPPGRGALVLEVNSMPAWVGLQSVTTFSIADRIAQGLLAALFDRDLRKARTAASSASSPPSSMLSNTNSPLK